MIGMDAALRRKVLADREACEKAFDIEIDAQNVIEGVEFLTDAAIRSEQEVVELPTSLAAAAVLVLNGVVTRPANRPRKSWRAPMIATNILTSGERPSSTGPGGCVR